MKRIVSTVLAGVVVVSLGGVAMAEEGHLGGTEIAVGVKSWVNDWKREVPGEGSTKSDNIMLVGPAVEVEFANHLFAEASYLFSTSNYTLDETGVDANFDRKDFDLAVGYSFLKYFGVFAGYRDSAFEKSNSNAKETSYGPLLGVRGSVAVNDALSVYAKGTYLITRLKTEEDGNSAKEDAPGWIAEIGVKYAFTKHLGADLGYKYERTKGDSDIKDTFQGVTLGVSYTFE